jgi:amidase
VEVLSSFIGRTIIAHHLTNPLADVRFEQALERARYLDRYLAENGRTIGPLHGLPMTIKDAFDIEGLPTSLGFVALEDNVAHVDDDLVQRLTSAGAIFFTKTNVPQSLMSGECANLLFGRTASPYNVTLSAGGSSGGEGSLIALGGSPLGVGSDIAGSIRTPANFNGIYGLCPSYGRLPCRNPQRSHSNLIINGVAGPMSRSIDGLEVYVKALLSTKPWEWDSSVVEMPWDQSKFESAQGVDGAKLCFGFVAHDGVVQPHPPIVRGMEELKRSIAQDGHSTIDIDFFDGDDRLWETALKIFSRDGGTELRGTAARYNEPLLPETMVPSPGDTLSLLEYFEVARNIQSFRQKYLQRLDATRTMTRTGRPVDALILPSGAHVAPPHGTMSYWLYEAISNVLDWTCATIPVGFVDEQVDEVQQPQPCMPLTPEDSANQAMCTYTRHLLWGSY